jgi:hypothetical protein
MVTTPSLPLFTPQECVKVTGMWFAYSSALINWLGRPDWSTELGVRFGVYHQP